MQPSSAALPPQRTSHSTTLLAFMPRSWLVVATMLITVPALAHAALTTRIALVNERIAKDADNGDLYLERAELHREHDDWSAALSDYSLAREHGVDAALLLFYRGRMHYEAGEQRQALALLNERLDAQPDHVAALLLRARIGLHNPADAVADIDRAIALLDTPTPDVYLQRARIAARLTPTNCTAVADGLQQAIRRLGPLVSLVSFAVDTCAELGQHELAMSFVAQLPGPIRAAPIWRARAGDLLLAGGKKDEARREFNAALRTIDALPAARRNSRALRELKRHVHAQIAATTDH